MTSLAGIVLRLTTIKVEFGDTAFARASHAASIAVARFVLELAEQRAANATRPPCAIVPLVLISRDEDE